MLHFHRFEHEKRFTRFRRLARFGLHRDPAAGHRWYQPAIRCGGRAARRWRMGYDVEPEAFAAAREMHRMRLDRADRAIIAVERDVLAAHARPVRPTLASQ